MNPQVFGLESLNPSMEALGMWGRESCRVGQIFVDIEVVISSGLVCGLTFVNLIGVLMVRVYSVSSIESRRMVRGQNFGRIRGSGMSLLNLSLVSFSELVPKKSPG